MNIPVIATVGDNANKRPSKQLDCFAALAMTEVVS